MRRLVAGGPDEYFEVTCAVLADGVTSPADAALTALEHGFWANDTDRSEGDPWPDETQPHDYVRLLAEINVLIDHKEPKHQKAVNVLEEGIWEFKVARKRFTFYDTMGDGTFTPKFKHEDRETAPYPASDFWWFPTFDQQLRLGHVFGKEGHLAGRENIESSKQVREEDLAHDTQDNSALSDE